jgi:hypothetical protein
MKESSGELDGPEVGSQRPEARGQKSMSKSRGQVEKSKVRSQERSVVDAGWKKSGIQEGLK